MNTLRVEHKQFLKSSLVDMEAVKSEAKHEQDRYEAELESERSSFDLEKKQVEDLFNELLEKNQVEYTELSDRKLQLEEE
jgi:uncharacterized membrane-anchored protein YhcB (DUF1043 family)